MKDHMRVLAGNAAAHLVTEVCDRLSIEPTQALVGRFADGEVRVQIKTDVRGCDVFIINSTPPPAENIMETVLLGSAARQASARRVTLVIPYLGYARQDRKDRARVPVSAKVVIEMLKLSHADRVLLLDLHSEAIASHFEPMVVDHLYTSWAAVPVLQEMLSPPFVVAAPDQGGVPRALKYARHLGYNEYALFSKIRNGSGAVDKTQTKIVGDVEGRKLLFVDDIIDTGGTIIANAEAAKAANAESITFYAAHGLFSGQALANLGKSAIDEIIVTNSVQRDLPPMIGKTRVRTISIAPLLANAIRRIHEDQSLSALILG